MCDNRSQRTGVGAFVGNAKALIRWTGFEWAKEEDKIWNSNDYRNYTNCYAYAFDMLAPPKNCDKYPTEKYHGKFPAVKDGEGGLQLGVLSSLRVPEKRMTSGEKTHYFEENKDAKSVAERFRNVIHRVEKDMETVGISFKLIEPNDNGMADGYRVALVLRSGEEWHWYREGKNGGGWSHKQGSDRVRRTIGTCIRTCSLSYDPFPLSNDIEKDAAKIGYDVFVGYFYVTHPPTWSENAGH